MKIDYNAEAKIINEFHSKVMAHQMDALRNARDCGERLLKVRDAMSLKSEIRLGSGRPPIGKDQGGWSGWVKKNCHFALSTVNTYILIFKNWTKVKNEKSIRDAETLIRINTPKGKYYKEAYAKLLCKVFRAEIRKWPKQDRKALYERPELMAYFLAELKRAVQAPVLLKAA